MRGVTFFAASLLVLSAGQGLQRTLADELHVQIHPESVGPFPGGVGGQIPYTVSVEIVDVESDGYDSQGVGGISWDVFTDTGAAPPVSGPALTGEVGFLGPARVDDQRYVPTNGTDELFLGGYGFQNQFGPFSGSSVVDDDLMDVWALLPPWWLADVEPNVPGLQPEAMGGIGISERPAGGAWVLAEGFLNYPAEPGVYTIDVVPTIGVFILPDLDLSQDHAPYRAEYAPEQLIGDSFSFVVLPEPGALAILALGFLLCRRR